jgi:hypothetical protein
MTTLTLSLTVREIQIVAAALAVVSPSGGGSDVYSVLRRVWAQAPVESDHALEAQFVATVISEAREAGAL